MARIWRNRIIDRTRRYADVPMTWKAQVKNLLWMDVKKGIIAADEYEEFVGERFVE